MMGSESMILTVKLTTEQREKLREVAQLKYRIPNMSHAIRLLIEDAHTQLKDRGEKK